MKKKEYYKRRYVSPSAGVIQLEAENFFAISAVEDDSSSLVHTKKYVYTINKVTQGGNAW